MKYMEEVLKRIAILIMMFLIFLPGQLRAEEKVFIALVNNFSDFRSPCGDPRGVNFQNALNLAMEDFLSGHKEFKGRIKFQKYDYGSSPVNTEPVTERAIHDGAIALIGYPCSSFAILAAPIAEKYHVPMITPSATIDSLTKNRSYVYRASFRDEDQAEVMAKFLAKDRKKKKAVVVVNANYPYCVNLSEKFQRYFKRNGGKIVKVYNTLSTQKSYEKVIADMKGRFFDVVFIPNHELESSVIVKELFNSGLKTTVAGGDGWGNLYGYIFPAIVGEETIDAYAIAHWYRDSVKTKSKDFQKRYYERFGFYPNDNSALAYDAMSLLLEGIAKTKKQTRSELNKSLASIRSHIGVTGEFSYNRGDGTPSKNVYIVKYPQPSLAKKGPRRFVHHKSIMIK